MKIVEVETIEQMTDGNVYYELNGKFYALCGACGKPVAVDFHRTASDLRRDTDVERCFCSVKCQKNFIKANVPTWKDALFCGYDEEYRKFFPEEVVEDEE